jgi:hypothetical protein
VFLATIEDIRALHYRLGIPDDISWDTLGDLGIHVARYRRRNGCTGLDTQWWLALHWRGALFKLGRLQFEVTTTESGARALGIHIPAGGRLDPAECDASFDAASTFFPRYLPEVATRLATCTSWLLDDQLADYLPADSNIIRFQRRFTLVPGGPDEYDEIFRWVFDRPPASLDELSPRTRLERALIQHVRAGKRWRLRTGWLQL